MVDFTSFARSCISVHAVCGSITLLSGIVAIVTPKGGKIHRQAGIVFVIALIMALIIASPQILVRKNDFLGFLTPFVAYMALRGWIVIRTRRSKVFQKDSRTHLILVLSALLSGVGLIGMGFYRVFHGEPLMSFAGVYLGLGFLAVRLARQDWQMMKSKNRPALLMRHATLMLGAFTAAVTAFSAVNFPTEIYPPILVWLTPPAVGTVAIAWWVQRLKRQTS
ncbi:MAG: hypothetical protein AB1540_10265 [Bdellovibrionota bacterium]